MLFGLRVIVGGRSKGGAIFNPWRARTRPGKSLRASHCVARSMLLVKLGGSVVTEKDKLRTASRPAIRRLAGEPAAGRQPPLVVHGAGAFGHIVRSHHQLDGGAQTPAAR